MKLSMRMVTTLLCKTCSVDRNATLGADLPYGACPTCHRALSKETAARLRKEGCNVLAMTSKAQRTRVARNMLPILYSRLQEALKKRRRDPIEFKLTLSHKHATVNIKPAPDDDIRKDREVRDVLKRIKNLLQKNQ